VSRTHEQEEYGPYHRFQSAAVNELVERTGLLGGHPARNIAAGFVPKVKAYEGPLPPGRAGIEFVTSVAPDLHHVPGCPVWSGPRTGVVASMEEPDLVLIPVTIVKRVDA
jgi:hypothetical protein